MKVIRAKSAGFCEGVKRAVEKARELAQTSTEPVHTDGALIHNEQMMKILRAEGISECDDVSSLSEGSLLVRAHGIPPERRNLLKTLPIRLVDATCRDVARIQGLIKKRTKQGYHTVVFGDAGHPEVVGLLGFAEGNGTVISNTEEIALIPQVERLCLVAQSTQFPACFDRIASALLQRFPDAEVVDTICESTKARQSELRSLAEQADVIVVVGGKHSANTLRLVALAGELKPTVHIQTADQLDPADFEDRELAGLTAGASTPEFIIDEVAKSLESL